MDLEVNSELAQSGTQGSMSPPPTSPLQLTEQDIQNMSDRAVLLTNRDYLLNVHCVENQISQRDVFTKAKEYARHVYELRDLGVMQYGVPIESKPGPTVTMEFFGEKRTMIMFASNDYLNLSTDPRVHEAIRKTLNEYGVGAGSSRVGTGFSYLHKDLEARLADAFGKEAALLFPTGFDAIASPPVTLCTSKDRILVDGSSHACILEGAYASGATVRVFAHNDAERLEDTLRRSSEKLEAEGNAGGLLVMVEGAYSMDGDLADLPKFTQLCKKYGARLMVDEAHSVGVHGKFGHGSVEHFGLQKEVDIIAGTFSKSLGATGGFVAADKELITYLNYMSRKIVFSAALPPILVAGVKAALEIMETDSSLREKLWENVNHLASGLKQVGATILGIETASVPVLIGNDGVMFKFTHDLIQEGIFTFPVVYPTVPKGKSIFRLALQSRHSKDDLDHTIEVFGRLLRKYGIISN